MACKTYMFCVIWYHLYNLKNVKNTQGEALLLVTSTFVSYTLENTFGKCDSETSPEIEFYFLKKYVNRKKTVHTHQLITKSFCNLLSATDDKDCNKSVDTSIRIMPGELNKE